MTIDLGFANLRLQDGNLIGIIDVPGHERFEVPMVDKRKAQVLSLGEHVSVMDLESFENFGQIFPEW